MWYTGLIQQPMEDGSAGEQATDHQGNNKRQWKGDICPRERLGF